MNNEGGLRERDFSPQIGTQLKNPIREKVMYQTGDNEPICNTLTSLILVYSDINTKFPPLACLLMYLQCDVFITISDGHVCAGAQWVILDCMGVYILGIISSACQKITYWVVNFVFQMWCALLLPTISATIGIGFMGQISRSANIN